MATVLVVDHGPEAVRFARANLERLGHTVHEAGDGEAALTAVHAVRPDLLLLEVTLPRLDGWGVLERLKADPDERIRTIPVVLHTALDSEIDRLRGGIEGAVRVVAKPSAPGDLADAVQQVLDGGPEPAQRKVARHLALTRLARIEGGHAGVPEAPLVRLSRLERPRRPRLPDRLQAVAPVPAPEGDLTDKQRQMLQALLAAPSVSEAAVTLGMSRSNIYASLRRIGRTLNVADVSTVLRLLRSGALAAVLEP